MFEPIGLKRAKGNQANCCCRKTLIKCPIFRNQCSASTAKMEYISRWNEEGQRLYEEFGGSQDPEIPDHLLRSLDADRLENWTSAMEGMELVRSSRKA